MEDVVGSIITVAILAAIGLGLLSALRAGMSDKGRRLPVYGSTSPPGPHPYIQPTTVAPQSDQEEPSLLFETPTWAQPEPSRAEAEPEAMTQRERAPRPAAPGTAAGPSPRRAIVQLFHSGRPGLRLAILAQEILGPPQSLRATDDDAVTGQ